MRRLFIVLLLLLLPGAVFAQENNDRILYEYDKDTYIDTNLGFRFYYPVDWVFGTGNGISFAENQADLDAQLDTDTATVPEGVVIGVVGFPLEQFAEQLGDNPTTDEAAALVESQSGIDVIGHFDLPVMAHRAVSIVGIKNDNGRYGIASVWLSEDFLNIMTISAPDQDTLSNLAYSWGVITSMVEPLDAAKIGNSVLDSAEKDFVVPIPEGWVLNPDLPGSVFELQEDIDSGGENTQGMYIFTDDKPLAERDLQADAAIEDLTAANTVAFGVEPDRVYEFLILGQPTTTFKAATPDGSGNWVVATQFIYNGRAITLFAIAPNKDKMDTFYPTWIALLSHIHDTGGSA